MQLTIRIDADNYVVVNCRVQKSGGTEGADGPELIEASFAEQKLSFVEVDDLLSLVGQVVDFFSTEKQPAVPVDDDWREAFRAGKL